MSNVASMIVYYIKILIIKREAYDNKLIHPLFYVIYFILQLRLMQQYAVDCMLHIVIAVYSVLYFGVSLHQCSAFVSVLCL